MFKFREVVEVGKKETDFEKAQKASSGTHDFFRSHQEAGITGNSDEMVNIAAEVAAYEARHQDSDN